MVRYLPLLFFLGFALWRCDSTKENQTTYHPHKLDTVPYSESVQVGDMLYISGQIANVDDDYNKIVEGGIRPQVNHTKRVKARHCDEQHFRSTWASDCIADVPTSEQCR